MEINAGQIYSTLFRRFDKADHEDIQDALAESHVAAWVARESGMVLHNVDAFCTVVAKRTLSRQLQRQKRFLYPDHDPVLKWKDLEGAPQVSKTEIHETVIDVADILEQAPESYAEVLRLHYLEGLPLEEAAEKLGVSGACLRKRHERALKWAKKQFASP